MRTLALIALLLTSGAHADDELWSCRLTKTSWAYERVDGLRIKKTGEASTPEILVSKDAFDSVVSFSEASELGPVNAGPERIFFVAYRGPESLWAAASDVRSSTVFSLNIEEGKRSGTVGVAISPPAGSHQARLSLSCWKR